MSLSKDRWRRLPGRHRQVAAGGVADVAGQAFGRRRCPHVPALDAVAAGRPTAFSKTRHFPIAFTVDSHTDTGNQNRFHQKKNNRTDLTHPNTNHEQLVASNLHFKGPD